MRKHYSKLLLSLLFLLGTAMTCDDSVDEITEIPAILKDVTLSHWNNAGEQPEKVAENKIPKEAYLLEICLLTEEQEGATESYTNGGDFCHVLSDGIEKIQIYSDAAINKDFPAGADISSCFSNYPVTINKYQLTDPTVHGGTISVVDKTNRIYKALLTVPQPGIYHFRVVLTMESGDTVEKITEPVTFY